MIRKIFLIFIMCSLAQLVSCASGPDTQDDDQIESDSNANVDTDSKAENDIEDGLDSTDSPKEKSSADNLKDAQASNDELDLDSSDDSLDNTKPAEPEKLAEPATPPPAAATEQPPAAAEVAPPPPPSTTEVPMAQASGAEITNIGYLANNNGGTIVIDSSGPIQYSKRYNSGTNQFVIEIQGAHLPDRLKRPFIMKEFAGSFGAINAYQSMPTAPARIVVQLKGEGGEEPILQQEGNQLMLMPPSGGAVETAQEEPSSENLMAKRKEKALAASSLDEFLMHEPKYYGAEISVQTKDADVRDVLNFIADQSGANMIISDDVQGKISIKLRKVPWDQALVTVMRAKKLGYIRQGEILRISTLAELKSEADSTRQIVESQKASEPLKMKIIPINYANLDELMTNLPKFISKRGSVAQDKQSTSIILTDTEDVLERLSAMIKDIDIPIPQVMIEGKVVEATSSFERDVGINWSFSGAPTTLSSAGGASGSPINMNPSLSVSPVSQQTLAGSPLSFGVQIGTLDVIGNLNATLALNELDETAKVLSSPRIVTMNKQLATITQKGENLTKTTSVTGSTVQETITRTPIVLQLQVTPQITADGSVIMDMNVQRDFPGAPIPGDTTGAREINSRVAKTKVLVRSGQTAVIGGIYENDDTRGETGVPVLKDIPILGWLFKSRSTTDSKDELLIFLTPRILNSPKELDSAQAPSKQTSS